MIPYFISAHGAIHALGKNTSTICDNLLTLQAQHSKEDILNTLKKDYISYYHQYPVYYVRDPLPEINQTHWQYRCRNNQLLLAAYHCIEPRVEAIKRQVGAHRISIVLGSSTSGIAATEQAFAYYQAHQSFPKDYHFYQHELGSVSQFLARYAHITGHAYTISTACSSSAKAFLGAYWLLKHNLADACIVGGVDSLCELTLRGFESLGLLSTQISNPMSKNRCGINIGEGAALFILEKPDLGIVPPEHNLSLLGVGESSDAYHMSSPDPQGLGAQAAIKQALEQSQCTPQDIDYIHLHGTGTIHNDAAESQAVYAVFGDSAPCSSTKPMTGHTLGAAGALGVSMCYISLTSKKHNLPIHLYDQQKDTTLSSIKLIESNTCAYHCSPKRALSQAFAFGGSNCAVVIGTPI